MILAIPCLGGGESILEKVEEPSAGPRGAKRAIFRGEEFCNWLKVYMTGLGGSSTGALGAEARLKKREETLEVSWVAWV